MKSKDRIARFISEQWGQFRNEFDLRLADSATEETVIRLTLSKVLNSRRVIATIKGKVKL